MKQDIEKWQDSLLAIYEEKKVGYVQMFSKGIRIIPGESVDWKHWGSLIQKHGLLNGDTFIKCQNDLFIMPMGTVASDIFELIQFSFQKREIKFYFSSQLRSEKYPCIGICVDDSVRILKGINPLDTCFTLRELGTLYPIQFQLFADVKSGREKWVKGDFKEIFELNP